MAKQYCPSHIGSVLLTGLACAILSTTSVTASECADRETPTLIDIRLDGAPAARWHALSVWTSSELLIWGGYGWDRGLIRLASGGRFYPARNTWRGMGQRGAPGSRSAELARAVWTGTDMVIVGGTFAASEPLAARYNPDQDQWATLSPVNAPARRTQPIVAWTGRELLVWGGAAQGGQPVGDGARYDPAADAWRPISRTGAPDPRWGAASAWSGSELLVWGGTGVAGLLADGAAYNPSTDSWRPLPPAPLAPRSTPTGVWTGEAYLIWGGQTPEHSDDPLPTRVDYLSDGALYWPASDTWTPISTVDAPRGRDEFAPFWTGRELVVWGGTRQTEFAPPESAVYHLAADTWTPLAVEGDALVRKAYSGVWTTCDIVLWGGLDRQSIARDDGGFYHAMTHPS